MVPARDGTIRLKSPFHGVALVNGVEMSGDVLDIDGKTDREIVVEPAAKPEDDPVLENAGQRIPGENWFGLKQIARF